MSDEGCGKGDLEARIRKAREQLEPKRGPNAAEKYKSLSTAWRMTLELVVGTGIGVAIGIGLDGLFDTMPLFLIVMGLFGFAAGVRTVMATAQEMNGPRTPNEAASADNEADDARR